MLRSTKGGRLSGRWFGKIRLFIHQPDRCEYRKLKLIYLHGILVKSTRAIAKSVDLHRSGAALVWI